MLNPENDPMGHAISEYYSTSRAGRLIVNSDISEADEIPVSYLFRTWDGMPEIEQRAIKLCRGHVLDVGAAAGAHSLVLLGRGIQTSSMDISALSVTTMKKRGISDVTCADFHSLGTKQKYDTLLFLMNGAGLAGTLDGLTDFFQKCKQLLKKDGQVLLDSSDIIYMYNSADEMPEYYYGEVRYQMIYRTIFSKTFDWLFVDFQTLARAAAEQGLLCTKIMDGSDYDYLAKLSLIKQF